MTTCIDEGRIALMTVWQAAVLLNLVLALGVGMGYAAWGRRVDVLARDLDGLRAQIERLERERAACGQVGQQQWEGRGVVRAVYPHLLVVSHDEIRGLLPARTTSFPATPASVGPPPHVGAPIRFSLRGTAAEDAAVVAIRAW
jgi:hypothetical protein